MEKSQKASMDSMHFFILYLLHHILYPIEIKKPSPLKVQGQDDHSDKCADFLIQFALKISFFYAKIDEQVSAFYYRFSPVTNDKCLEEVNHLRQRNINYKKLRNEGMIQHIWA